MSTHHNTLKFKKIQNIKNYTQNTYKHKQIYLLQYKHKVTCIIRSPPNYNIPQAQI